MSDAFQSAQVRQIATDLLARLFENSDELESILSVVDEVKIGKTLGQGFAFTEAELDVFLGMASTHFLCARYQESARLYAFVAMMNHFEIRAFKGAAMSLQRLGLYSEALQCLGVALLQDPENKELALMASECFSLAGDAKSAQEIIETLESNESKSRLIS
jgi:hypothetical protein